MDYLKVFIFAAILTNIPGSESKDPRYNVTSHKLVKVNEHQKDKNVLVVKKIDISSSSARNKVGQQSNPANKENEPEVVVFEQSMSRSYEEQSCPEPHPRRLEENADFAEQILSHGVYVLFASSFFYNKLSYLLTGRAFDENPNDACIRINVGKNERRYNGFGKTAVLSCVGGALDSNCTCPMTDKSMKVHVTAVWSDGANAVLMISCMNDRGGWAVASKRRSLDVGTKKEIRGQLESLGFDPSGGWESSYQNCAD